MANDGKNNNKDTFEVQLTVQFDTHTDSIRAQDVVYETLSKNLPPEVKLRAISAWRTFDTGKGNLPARKASPRITARRNPTRQQGDEDSTITKGIDPR